MQTTIKQQIKSIRQSRKLLSNEIDFEKKMKGNPERLKNLLETEQALNDAGSTLATLKIIAEVFIKSLNSNRFVAFETAKQFFKSVLNPSPKHEGDKEQDQLSD